MKKKSPSTHGGPGRGAGRKPSEYGRKRTKSLRLTPDVCDLLDSLVDSDKTPQSAGVLSASDFVDNLIRKSAEFQKRHPAKK